MANLSSNNRQSLGCSEKTYICYTRNRNKHIVNRHVENNTDTNLFSAWKKNPYDEIDVAFTNSERNYMFARANAVEESNRTLVQRAANFSRYCRRKKPKSKKIKEQPVEQKLVVVPAVPQKTVDLQEQQYWTKEMKADACNDAWYDDNGKYAPTDGIFVSKCRTSFDKISNIVHPRPAESSNSVSSNSTHSKSSGSLDD